MVRMLTGDWRGSAFLLVFRERFDIPILSSLYTIEHVVHACMASGGVFWPGTDIDIWWRRTSASCMLFPLMRWLSFGGGHDGRAISIGVGVVAEWRRVHYVRNTQHRNVCTSFLD